MASLDDDTLMSALSIPGTHDSAAFTSILPFVATQRLDILQQLNAGIRYFDLRCGLRRDVVEMVHGTALLGIRLDAVLDTMYIWLKAHPREALVVQIKQDRKEEDSKRPFSNAVVETLATRPDRWRTLTTTPTLGELRGKIQLFRRFGQRELYAYGINVSRWQDNPREPFTIHTYHGVQLTIQDHYNFPDPLPLPKMITQKSGDISLLLKRSVADSDSSHWYLNFASAFEFNLYYQIPPREVAAGGYWAFRWVTGINERLQTYLAVEAKGRNRYGIVIMDYPEHPGPDLVKYIIQSNFGKRTAISWIALLVAVAVAMLLLLLMLLALPIHVVCLRTTVQGSECRSLLYACGMYDVLKQRVATHSAHVFRHLLESP